MSLTYGSVCSGIEAATVAWHPLGWRPSFFSEIEAFPRAVLTHHYPEVPLHGDFTTIEAGAYRPIDLLVGGTPCQDFSVAGLRAGMAGDRGNLTLQFLTLAHRLRPKWVVWENVPGVLSANRGRDFGAFLGGLGELGYGWAYRTLDAQFFGVAQRRRRVFVVGYLGDWRRAAAVLFERESLSGNPAPSRTPGEGAAAPTAPSLTASGRGLSRTGESRGQDPVVAVSAYADGTVGTVASKWAKGTGGPAGDECYNLVTSQVTHTLKGEGFDASEDGTGRGTPLIPVAYRMSGVIAPTLRAGGNSTGGDRPPGTDVDTVESLIAYRVAGDGAVYDEGDRSATLTTGTDRSANIVFDTTQITSGANFSSPKPGDPCHPLAAHAHPPAVAFTCSDQANSFAWERPIYPTLDTQRPSDTSNIQKGVRIGAAVRRLTPVECARLQGFPDDYLDITYRGKPAADGPKYKALGNSMAVPVMAWIGRRIQMVEGLS